MKRYQFVDKTLADEIRSRRLELKLSQEDLAFEADVSQTSVSRVERGRRSSKRVIGIVVDTLQRLEAERAIASIGP